MADLAFPALIKAEIVLPIRQSLADLPRPSPEAEAHSRRVTEHIREAMRAAGGVLPFSRYMELALYAPGLGYYSAGARKFGAAGDFVTSPEISPLFSHCLARQCAEVLAPGRDMLLELGAGSGVMAAELLLELERMGRLPAGYLILEVSADLRDRQRATLASRSPGLLSLVRWLDALPESFSGVALGNEVLDALPVERFHKTSRGFEQFCVMEEGGSFAWTTRAAPEHLVDILTALQRTLPLPFPEDYISELCPTLVPLVADIAGRLCQGALLFLDYGYPRTAYYHAERSMGTLMCHYRQRAHDDPFLYPGLTDITAHVDFTAVAEAATTAGLDLAGYTTQAHFLMGLDIAAAADADPHRVQQVKRLTLPEEMGERFKAIGFTRGIDVRMSGFALRDLSHTL